MRVLTYEGGVAETSYRHPEQFTKLAPERFQQACLTHGGRPFGTSEPRLRLAQVRSRFQLVGGQEVAKLDAHGNLISRDIEELFIPKYNVPEHQRNWWVLEIWRPAEWFYQQRADMVALEYGEAGQAFRKMEPIWPEGAYRAVEWNIGQPFVFSPDYLCLESDFEPCSFRWGLWATLQSLSQVVDFKKEVQRGKDGYKALREQDKELYKEESREHRSGMFLEPTVSMSGAYRRGNDVGILQQEA